MLLLPLRLKLTEAPLLPVASATTGFGSERLGGV